MQVKAWMRARRDEGTTRSLGGVARQDGDQNQIVCQRRWQVREHACSGRKELALTVVILECCVWMSSACDVEVARILLHGLQEARGVDRVDK